MFLGLYRVAVRDQFLRSFSSARKHMGSLAYWTPWWFRVWGLGFGIYGLGFRVWGLGFGI